MSDKKPTNPLNLKNPKLLQQASFINNEFKPAKSSETIAVHNPFNGKFIGSIPSLSVAEIEHAVDCALMAQADWASKTAFARAKILHAWADLIDAHKEDLAIIMTSEQGKPIKESRGEIDYACSYIRFFAEEGKRIYGDILPADKDGMRYIVLKQPVGVCACITPWNFPVAMFARKVAPALASGSVMLVKPASQTPFSALAFGVLAVSAGLPKGVFQVITGKADTVGQVFTKNANIAKFSFTGSTEVGKKLMAQCSQTVKKVSLELGGNAPFIVFDDANLDSAVDGLIASKYRNAGQTCVCANRIYLHTAIKDEFIKLYQQKVEQLIVGNGLDETTDIGPLINQATMDKALTLMQNAMDQGATLVTGGQIHNRSKLCLTPTILDNVNENMDIATTEIFAPISAIYHFDDEKDVIRRANDTIFGLACYFYTNDLARSWRVSQQLEYGMVGQNTGLISTAVAPFGGIKQSGFGREGSKYGIEEYLNLKYWAINID
ncbi:succinic semialdehyde dehydrogenase Msp75 [Moraxella macacae 0408225]|uniref:Succinic semialdehyde dehydrogenase Msp75 n=1 Tax=Moraxella macacae 0408225 TaxID=1230338 RepID=L2F933_9GAMM|nr:NAD-dependent succinate-semialdehyde dehydrogenase [Moraxella macacae]ELA09276.1 succinic semialdehyde dehydrogenase Msp75 [Moraxella macacae 0408225]